MIITNRQYFSKLFFGAVATGQDQHTAEKANLETRSVLVFCSKHSKNRLNMTLLAKVTFPLLATRIDICAQRNLPRQI